MFQSIHPVGALMLVNYQLAEEDAGRPHGFRLQRGGGNRLQLAADTAEAAARWSAVLAHAIDTSNQVNITVEIFLRLHFLFKLCRVNVKLLFNM